MPPPCPSPPKSPKSGKPSPPSIVVRAPHPVAYFDGPGGTQVPRAVVEAMSDYLLHHNANSHWAFPTSEETDADHRAARASPGRFPERFAERDRLRREHDHAHVSSRARSRARLRAGRRDRAHRAGSPRQHRALARAGKGARRDHSRGEDDSGNRPARLGGFRPALERAHQTGGDRRRLERARHDQRHPPRRGDGARDGRADFRRCRPLRAARSWSMCARSIAISSVAPPTNSTARTSACSTERDDLLAALDFPKLLPSPNTAPERAETGTQNHEGMAGAAAAVDFLAVARPRRHPARLA